MMLVHFRITGSPDHHDDVKVRLAAVPREGEDVFLHARWWRVRTVAWYVQEDEDTNEPTAYVVVGPALAKRTTEGTDG